MAGSQQIPLTIVIAPFPEGFSGDMDETFQQATQLMEAYIEGNFLTGMILAPGSTLPTTDQGPIAMGDQWYFWDEATGQYVPQIVSVKTAKNFAKNPAYQIQQAATLLTPPVGISQAYDMSIARVTQPQCLTIQLGAGPVAGADNDQIPGAIAYVCGPALVLNPVATDLFVHEHIFEGSDISPLQGQTLSLSLSVWTNTPGTYSLYLTSSGRDATYVVQFTILSANTWVRIKVPGIPPLPIGTIGTWNLGIGQTGLYVGVCMCLGTQWETPTTNSWLPAFYAGTTANNNLLTVANNQMSITGIKLEANLNVTYLTVPAWDADYWDCTRYYFTTFNYQSVTNGVRALGRCPKDGNWTFSQLFPHRMCKAPTVTPYSIRATPVAGYFTDLSSNNDIPLASIAAQAKGVDDAQPTTISIVGNTHTTTIIDGIASTTGIHIGMGITGTGIPVGATVTAVQSGVAITISVATTSTLAGLAITINQVLKADTIAAFIVADARLS
jgi:hypothetical protein